MKIFFAASVLALSGLSTAAVAADVGLAGSLGSQTAISLPIRGDGYLVQPELSHYYRETKTGNYKNDGEQTAIGSFFYKVWEGQEGLSTQLGLGVGYTERSSGSAGAWGRDSEDVDGFYVAPAVAIFYDITSHISVGVEARYQYSKLSGKGTRTDYDYNVNEYTQEREDVDVTQSNTQTQIVARYFF